MSKSGVLFLNLGTPESPEPHHVGAYLKEFLLDPEVIDTSWLMRQLLVRGIIVPFRKHSSSKLYKKVWSEAGSPLLIHTRALARAVQNENPDLAVEFGFRYGEPSTEKALQLLQAQGVRQLFVLPLYPQYATSATRTTETFLYKELKISSRFEKVKFIQSFHDADFYLKSEVDLIRRHMLPDSHTLFSFHSLPIRQMAKNHQGCEQCLKKPTCERLGEACCYRRQCYETQEHLTQRLGLDPHRVSISFQSKLGREEWLTPSTEGKVRELAARGIKRLTTISAGFTADCLETVEELDHQVKEIFIQGGGETWVRVPCLNADPVWVHELSKWINSELNLKETTDGKTPTQSPN